jgi:hypothetical protein
VSVEYRIKANDTEWKSIIFESIRVTSEEDATWKIKVSHLYR